MKKLLLILLLFVFSSVAFAQEMCRVDVREDRVAIKIAPPVVHVGVCSGVYVQDVRGISYVLSVAHCFQEGVGDPLNTPIGFFDYLGSPNPLFVVTRSVVVARDDVKDYVLLRLPIDPPVEPIDTFVDVPKNGRAWLLGHPESDRMSVATSRDARTWEFSQVQWVATFQSGIIESGSSGSPLMDRQGNLIGLLVAALQWKSCGLPENDIGLGRKASYIAAGSCSDFGICFKVK